MNTKELANSLLENLDKVETKKVNKYALPSRGRKLCPKCNSYVGVRTKICDCGHEFVKGESVSDPSATVKNAEYDEPISDEDRRYALAVGLANGCTIIHAGAGACPAKLNTTDYKGVAQFCEDIVADGARNKKLYMPEAIKCWLRNFVDANDEDYVYICDLIDNWYNDKVASTMGMEV